MNDVQDEVETLVNNRIRRANETTQGLIGEYLGDFQNAIEYHK